jgi:hypothetical protein
MSEVLSSKSLYVPKWDGKGSKFQLRWTRFRAFATICRFAAALGSTVIDPAMPATEANVIPDTDPGKVVQAAKDANYAAMAQLTMAFTTEAAMTFIYDGMTNVDWPNGLAFMVINTIKHMHLPNNTIAKVELRRMMNGIKMKKTEDPVVLFNQIAAVKVRSNQPGAPVEDSEFIAIVIAQAPDAYQGVLTSEQLRQGTSLQLEHLATAMDMQWRAMGGGPSPDGKDDGEIALGAFNGICFICKQKGHRAFQCPIRSPANSGPAQQGGTKPKCAHCHTQGHEEARCWDKPGNNENLKPQWLKNKEQAAGVEILLAALTFPHQLAFLEDPNMWIGDTAATSNSTPHDIGMCDIHKPKASDSITMGNGMSEIAQKIGNIAGTVCNKFGNQVMQNAKIQDVTLIRGGRFNLFSISKLQMEGWIMRGDRHGITLRKGDKSLVFDMIVVPTPN